jgi:hypothetical protein
MRFGKDLRLSALLSVLGLLALAPGSAAAFTVQGLVGTGGYACLSTTATGSCQSDRDFETLNQSGSASGSIDYSGGDFGTLDINVTVGSILLDEQLTGPPATGGFEDVARIVFSTVTYTMTGMNATNDGSGVIQGLGAASGTVSGSYETRDGSGGLLVGPTAFSSIPVKFSSVLCPADGQGQCSFTVGFFRDGSPAEPFRLSVQGVTPGNSANHDFVHTFNLVVPEPASAGLLLIGLAGLAAGRSRRA